MSNAEQQERRSILLYEKIQCVLSALPCQASKQVTPFKQNNDIRHVNDSKYCSQHTLATSATACWCVTSSSRHVLHATCTCTTGNTSTRPYSASLSTACRYTTCTLVEDCILLDITCIWVTCVALGQIQMRNARPQEKDKHILNPPKQKIPHFFAFGYLTCETRVKTLEASSLLSGFLSYTR